MPKENTTRYIILGLLSHEPQSGYDMKKRMDISLRHFWPVGFGQIYPTLNELSREGLIEQTEGSPSKGPEKHLYDITQSGREALHTWLMEPEDREYTKYEILLKLFFGAQGDKPTNLLRIQAFGERQAQNLAMMRIFKGELSAILDSGEDHLYYYLTALFGEYVYEAYVRWVEEAKVLLSQAIKTEDRT